MPIGVLQYSGSLITARLAMKFGREVFGVPGNVTQDVSFAPNLLIKPGAKLVANAEDLLEEFPTPGLLSVGARRGWDIRATELIAHGRTKCNGQKGLRAA
jgi:predicted Rossmann fold nucleotide-binding protein DprA/Smf involved in DNA uptake